MIDTVVYLDRATLDQTRALVACAHLQAVHFSKFSFKFFDRTDSAQLELELDNSNRVSVEAADSGMIIRFDLRLRGMREKEVRLDISAQIAATYALPADSRPSHAQMKMFGQANGTLNIWPYWREYVQSATSRAGLPPLTMPLFRIVPKKDLTVK